MQHTMTPEEQAAWLETMRRGELPAGLYQGEVRRASQRRAKARWNAKALQASHEGKQLECVHHWLLERPNGATTKAVCKKCGAEREFPSAAEEQEQSAYYKARAKGRQSRWNGALGSSQQVRHI